VTYTTCVTADVQYYRIMSITYNHALQMFSTTELWVSLNHALSYAG